MQSASHGLTTRECQILTLIGQGESSKEIAHALGISVWTVASHRKRICAKLGVHTAAELVALCAVEGAREAPATGRLRRDACLLMVDFRGEQGRVQFTFSGRLRPTPGAVTVQIGRKTFYF